MSISVEKIASETSLSLSLFTDQSPSIRSQMFTILFNSRSPAEFKKKIKNARLPITDSDADNIYSGFDKKAATELLVRKNLEKDLSGAVKIHDSRSPDQGKTKIVTVKKDGSLVANDVIVKIVDESKGDVYIERKLTRKTIEKNLNGRFMIVGTEDQLIKLYKSIAVDKSKSKSRTALNLLWAATVEGKEIFDLKTLESWVPKSMDTQTKIKTGIAIAIFNKKFKNNKKYKSLAKIVESWQKQIERTVIAEVGSKPTTVNRSTYNKLSVANRRMLDNLGVNVVNGRIAYNLYLLN